MDQKEIEAIVGRLYLLIMDQQRQIDELKAQLSAPKASVLSMASRSPEDSA